VTCPGCGVAVAVGYPKCPRCHATVPQAQRAKRATFREEAMSGGTSLAAIDEDEPGAPVGWIAFGVLLLVGGGIAIWLATRDTPRAVEATGDEEEVEEAAEPVEPGEEPLEEEEETTPGTEPGVEEESGPDLSEVARDVDLALRGAQLWSKVSVDGDALVIESSLCDDPGVWTTVMGEAVGLRDAGAKSVRCQEPHGGVVFDRRL
jgi:hypothetical protein